MRLYEHIFLFSSLKEMLYINLRAVTHGTISGDTNTRLQCDTFHTVFIGRCINANALLFQCICTFVSMQTRVCIAFASRLYPCYKSRVCVKVNNLRPYRCCITTVLWLHTAIRHHYRSPKIVDFRVLTSRYNISFSTVKITYLKILFQVREFNNGAYEKTLLRVQLCDVRPKIMIKINLTYFIIKIISTFHSPIRIYKIVCFLKLSKYTKRHWLSRAKSRVWHFMSHTNEINVNARFTLFQYLPAIDIRQHRIMLL